MEFLIGVIVYLLIAVVGGVLTIKYQHLGSDELKAIPLMMVFWPMFAVILICMGVWWLFKLGFEKLEKLL